MVEATRTGMEAVIEQATWFWQDMFKVYAPRVFAKMRNVPVPRFILLFFSFLHLFVNVLYSSRTEYMDDEIEFVLENLDISGFNILPSHVYIRNITDVDIITSDMASAPIQPSAPLPTSASKPCN